MDKQQILQIASQSPDFPQAVEALKQEIASNPITPEGLAELIQMFEMALNNPEQYPAILEAAIQDDYIEPGDLPEQFDAVILISALAALYIVQAEMESGAGMEPEMGMPQPPAFARGGLAQAAQRLAAQGRGGDTMLAHINPREAAMLRRAGGGGSINPVTGLPEYFSLKKFIGAVLPIALNFIVPGAGAALGAALGATGMGASILGGALIGGASSALSGGKFGQGALLGGLGGGLGSVVGGAANSAMGLGLGEAGQSILGSGLVGGFAGAATGQGFGKGALQGAGGAYLGQAVGGIGGEGFKSAGQTFGNMMTAGYDPKTSALAGGLSGLATAMSRPAPTTRSGLGFKSPSDIVVGELQSPSSTYGGVPDAGLQTNYMTGDVGYQGPADFAVDYSLQNPGAPVAPVGFGGQDIGSGVMPSAGAAPGANIGTGAAAAKGTGLFGTNVSAGQALALASMAGSLGSAPQPVQQAVKTLSPEQQEYFNRPSVTFDWNRMQQDASRSGLSLNQYMAQAWPQITGGAYNQTVQRPGYARGGALSQVARMARGSGSGRADTIDAKLSDGEYVMDAETVAMLGDGSTKEGARRLDQMRTSLRAHKGKALAKGKFSPNAKSPLSYLKEAA
jgi:hypothetical protein